MQTEFLRFAIADEEDDSLWIHPAHIGYGSGTVQPHVHLGEGLCTKVYQTDETVLIQETQGEPGTTGVQLGTRSALAIPIHVGGRIVGVMNLESRRPHAFGEEELNFYTAIAAQMGIALENARLYQAVSRHAQESEAALVQMQELDRHKNEFMQNVSHELRTPLSLILGYSEWLVDNELGELPIQQREMIKIVHRQTCILRDLVEDIALTWLSEVRPLTHEVVALDELLRSVLNDYRPQARQAGLRLHAHLARHLPPVQGAPEYLRRVLANLMSNALKFTPRGGTVRVDMLGQGEHLVVSVTDTGIGIPPHHHERIFERFTQVDGSIRRKYGGSGLGLALVKQIVEAHKGTVKVESKLGKGSKFTIRLPAAGA
jgi:signal transduction histidine kinase